MTGRWFTQIKADRAANQRKNARIALGDQKLPRSQTVKAQRVTASCFQVSSRTRSWRGICAAGVDARRAAEQVPRSARNDTPEDLRSTTQIRVNEKGDACASPF